MGVEVRIDLGGLIAQRAEVTDIACAVAVRVFRPIHLFFFKFYILIFFFCYKINLSR